MPTPDATATGSRAAPPAGRARLLGDGIIYSSPGLCTRACRHSATLIVAVGERALQVRSAGSVVEATLVAVRPQVERALLAEHAPFVLIDLEPNHPQYRAFAGLVAPGGVQALAVERHRDLLRLARGFAAGRLCGRALDDALADALPRVAATWPAVPPLDLRVRQMMTVVEENPACPLGTLARLVGLSPHRASQLFTQSLGLSLRHYRLSCKVRTAASYMGSGRSLTDIAQAAGFVDSAHFARFWTRAYGAPPSVFFPPGRTAMDAAAQPDWLEWHRQRRAPGRLPVPTDPPLVHAAARPRG